MTAPPPVGATDLTGASRYLGVSPRYVKELLEAGELPALRLPGGRYRIGYQALDALLARGCDMATLTDADLAVPDDAA